MKLFSLTLLIPWQIMIMMMMMMRVEKHARGPSYDHLLEVKAKRKHDQQYYLEQYDQ